MSRFEILLATHCPNGVRFVPLDEFVSYEQPTKYLVSSTAYDDAYQTPVLTAGQTFILGYTDESEGIYLTSKECPVIIFDDFTTAFKWVDFPFKAKSSAMKILTPKKSDQADFRFIFYAMSCIGFAPQDHARHWIAKYSQFTIPLPPIEVQREIVRILDTFSKLEAELEAELESERRSRLSQTALLRAQLLPDLNRGFPARRLRELVGFRNAKAHEKLVDPDGDIALLTSRFVSTEGKVARFVRRENVLTPALKDETAIVMSDLPNGRALAKAFYVDRSDAYAANQRVGLLRVSDAQIVHPRYLYYMVDRNPQLLAYDNGLDQTHLKKDWILDILIPLPPLEDQMRIAETLDRLLAGSATLLGELTSEQMSRRQQYEHYRDRLLTFQEATA